ncbi:hypothetical protein [Catelliglobosispora koreensis]|uniref:hypothetical protein n=1 Tax=Catelliglobosispora koreensis TaxID=129052 RepID=UPI00035F4B34|nr:hypothetical protein [Catelliglobosispora koreensis]
MTIALPAVTRRTAYVYGLGACAVAALAIALRAPLATTVIGLILFGALHNVLELRYVAGRFAGVLNGRLLWTVLAFITGIVICRLANLRTAEVLLAYTLVAFALKGKWRWLGRGGLACLAAVSLTWPAYHFVMLAHLHNVVPLFFLWEWSRDVPQRALFRATQLGWVLVIPALILAGAFDPLLDQSASAVVAFAGDTPSLVTPPGVTAGLRFLAVFAFLQTMHYVVWIGFFPRYAPEAAAAFEQRVPWLKGGRAWLLGAGAALLLGLLFLTDYRQGRTVYQAFASYHAYLEFPVMLALLLRRK